VRESDLSARPSVISSDQRAAPPGHPASGSGDETGLTAGGAQETPAQVLPGAHCIAIDGGDEIAARQSGRSGGRVHGRGGEDGALPGHANEIGAAQQQHGEQKIG